MNPVGSKAAFDSFNEIATVRIELRDSDPLIWRQIEVPTSITLKVLHDIIQAAMGWFDYHLWEFTIAKRRYGLPTDEDWGTEPRLEAAKVRLREVLKSGRTTVDYLYDFGDSWEHRLSITDVRAGAGEFPDSTRPSTQSRTPNTRAMSKQSNGSLITILTRSTSCQSKLPSAASPTNETLPRPAFAKNSEPNRNGCKASRMRSSPDAYERRKALHLLWLREAAG